MSLFLDLAVNIGRTRRLARDPWRCIPIFMVNDKTYKGRLLILTGASGVGKTTLVEALKIACDDQVGAVFFHFDSVGVPSEEEMIEQHGSGANWQKAQTLAWSNRLLSDNSDRSLVVFEGQMNVDFIVETFDRHRFPNCAVYLIDCEEGEMERRLVEERGQPELATQDMRNWRNLLHQQAKDRGLPIIDTSKAEVDEAIAILLDRMNTETNA